MIEINLIPDVKQELIQAQRVRAVVISSSIVTGIIALAVVALLAVYVFGVQNVRQALADEGIKTGSAEMSKIEDLSKVLTIQNQLSKISAINEQKKITSRTYTVLQAVVPTGNDAVQISNLSVDTETNEFRIEGQAANSYSALEVFKKTIDGAVLVVDIEGEQQEIDLAADISTSDVSYGEDATGAKVLRFTLSFVYPDELFSPLVTLSTIKLTNAGNVTDSYLGVPRNIFVDRATDQGGAQ